VEQDADEVMRVEDVGWLHERLDFDGELDRSRGIA
jgi:hypothetical protein